MKQTITSPQVVTVDMVKVLVGSGACDSNTKARRLIKDGAVEIDGKVVGRYAQIVDDCVLRCGKHFWRKLCNTDTVTVDVTETDGGSEIKVL